MKMPRKSSDTFFISKYGYKRLSYCLVAMLVFGLLHLTFLFTLSLLCFFFMLYMYRNPERETPYLQKDSVISPVDGKVVMIETLDDGFVVTIKSSIFDTSILRSPVSSSVDIMYKIDGNRLPVELKKAKLLNEQAVVEFVEHGIRIEHVASFSSEGIGLASLSGCSIHQGARYGYMNGGLTSLYLPKSSRINVQRLEILKAGQTLIGYTSQKS